MNLKLEREKLCIGRNNVMDKPCQYNVDEMTWIGRIE